MDIFSGGHFYSTCFADKEVGDQAGQLPAQGHTVECLDPAWLFSKVLVLDGYLNWNRLFFFFFLPVLEAEKSKVKEQADSALGDL